MSTTPPSVGRVRYRMCRYILRSFVALFVFAALGPGAGDAVAKAPPLATTVVPVRMLTDPALDAASLATVPAGVDLELTGAATPGFLEVYYADEPAWVPAPSLAIGPRPGIDTAVTTADLPLLDAPLRDAEVLATVPEGETVILTGAHLDGYDAASHDGVGGWLDERGLAR